jgi:hypothetical protein
MKITPIPSGSSPAVAPSHAPEGVNVRHIKVRTNATPEAGPAVEAVSAQPEPTPTPGDVSVEATPAAEETKPLSPQLAALARQRRALQVKEQELAKREQALADKPPPVDVIDKARLQREPLRVLLEAGVTYDQLTEAVLADQGSQEIQALRNEIKTLKEGVDKSLVERDNTAEKQALAEMGKEVDRLTREGEAFEAIRATKSQSDVLELIHRTYKSTGELLTENEACKLVEDQLLTELLPIASLNKVKSRLAPAAPAPTQPQPQEMRTLTNRDTSRPVLDRTARAIAAFRGTLRK